MKAKMSSWILINESMTSAGEVELPAYVMNSKIYLERKVCKRDLHRSPKLLISSSYYIQTPNHERLRTMDYR